MITFLPSSSFTQSASWLDRARLGKQRLEVLGLLEALEYGTSSRWRRHPAARMWEGYERMLATYGVAICSEWVGRGYQDTMKDRIIRAGLRFPVTTLREPEWMNGPIHATHRAALLAKAPAHYGQFGWTEEPRIAYFWPVR